MSTSRSSDPADTSEAFSDLAAELVLAFGAWGAGGGRGSGEAVPPGPEAAAPPGGIPPGRPDGGVSARDPEGWTPERFESLALRAFRVQYDGNVLYRRYCEARGADPGSVADWRRIPPVPTAVFREVPLLTGEPAGVSVEFRTSGTTRGESRRGRHLVRDPRLYRASLAAAFRRFVLRPGGLAPLEEVRFCCLLPRFRDSDASSLSWMAEAVVEHFGRPGATWAAGPGGLRLADADRATRRAAATGEPLCILTTTLALDQWTRKRRERGDSLHLPDGSRVMDTGGTKGREGLRRRDVLARAETTLGLGRAAVVNEFGMTELLSQRYSVPGGGRRGSSGAGPARRGRREGTPARAPGEPDEDGPWLRAPPWLRTRALDPVTLEPLPPGEEGVLCHVDLANLGSVCSVLTEDRGRVRHDGSVQWIGRTPGSPPRGCSLATAEMLGGRA